MGVLTSSVKAKNRILFGAVNGYTACKSVLLISIVLRKNKVFNKATTNVFLNTKTKATAKYENGKTNKQAFM